MRLEYLYVLLVIKNCNVISISVCKTPHNWLNKKDYACKKNSERNNGLCLNSHQFLRHLLEEQAF